MPRETYDSVVVPLDGSHFSERALPVAAWFAAKLHADIQLISAVQSERDVPARQHELSSVTAGDVPTELSIVVEHDAAKAIHAAAQSRRAVVCMATHGRGRSAGLIGSVATEIAAHFHEAVLMVGPMAELAARPEPWRVVVCVDESPLAGPLVAIASRWATFLGAELTVITVAEPVPESLHGPAHRAFGPDGDIEAYLRSVVADAHVGDALVRTAVVWDPVSPAGGAADYLDAHDTALVVTSSHAREGLPRLALGSVAASLVHRSPAPVLMVPSPALQGDDVAGAPLAASGSD